MTPSPRTALLLLVVATAPMLPACRRPSPVPKEARVAIVEFTLADGVQVTSYNAAYDTLGQQAAQMVVQRLQNAGMNAVYVPANSAPEGDLIVTTRITRIGGGSAAKRALIGWGAGHAVFGVHGEVRRGDGTEVAEFSTERIGGGWTNVGSVENAMEFVRNDLAKMIYTGQYTGGRLGSPGAEKPTPAAAATRQPAVSERLRQLDTLRNDGLINDAEYAERRAQILDDL